MSISAQERCLDQQDVTFNFVECLASELSSGLVNLPSFPSIGARVRQVLSDPESSLDTLVRVVGSEPAMAARIMRLSNSPVVRASGGACTDLRSAINRMGHNLVCIAAMSFAIAQFRNDVNLACIKSELDELWDLSTVVAAFAFILAKSCTQLNPDEAMLAGMMHGIGRLYILSRAAINPELFESPNRFQQIVDEWHAQIGKVILENWQFSDEIVLAVANQQDVGRENSGPADLSDVISTALLLGLHSTRIGTPLELEVAPAARRLGLGPLKLPVIMEAFNAEIGELREALGL